MSPIKNRRKPHVIYDTTPEWLRKMQEAYRPDDYEDINRDELNTPEVGGSDIRKDKDIKDETRQGCSPETE